MSGPSTSSNRIKFHCIWTPPVHWGIRALVVFATGIVVSWIVAYALAILVVWATWDTSKGDPPTSHYITAVLLGLMGPVVWVTVFIRMRNHKVNLKTPNRQSRLNEIRLETAARVRLPHRVLEYWMRSRSLSNKLLRRHVLDMPNGTTILANAFRPNEFPRPTMTPTAFEPIDLESDSERVLEMIRANIEASEWRPEIQNSHEGKGGRNYRWSPRSRRRNAIIQVLWTAVWMTFFVRYFVKTGAGIQIYTISFYVAIVLAAQLIPYLFERKWWLVPGGLIYRDHGLWRKNVNVGVIRAVDSALVVDMRAGIAFVRVDHRFFNVVCPGWAGWALVAGWISQGRTPTAAEADALLGSNNAARQSC